MLHNRWIKWGLIAFVAFYLFTNPTRAAHTVHSAIGLVQTGAGQVSTFVSTVLK